jgi:hypothetical protein
LPRAVFDQSTQDPFAFGSGEFQTNTGGRPIAYFGEEPLSDYGSQPSAQDIQAQQAQRSGFLQNPAEQPLASSSELTYDEPVYPGSANASARPQALNIRSMRDPATGEYNIVVPAEGQHLQRDLAPRQFQPPPKPQPSTAKATPRRPGKYTVAQVPKSVPELIAFIDMLHDQHPGYHQAVYNKEGQNASRLRQRTIAKMRTQGLIE